MSTKEHLHEAADVLDRLAAGRKLDRGALLAAALTLTHCNDESSEMLDALAGLKILAKGGTLGRDRAKALAQIVRQSALCQQQAEIRFTAASLIGSGLEALATS